MSTDFAPLSVLIVDDEAPARDRLRDLLGDIADTQPTRIAGMAASGVEALAVLEREPVDLVLTDIRMPAMDGIELARHLGRLPQSPAVIFACFSLKRRSNSSRCPLICSCARSRKSAATSPSCSS